MTEISELIALVAI